MGPTRAAGPFGVPVFAIVFTIILFGCAQAIKPNNCYKRAFCADRTDGLYCENNTTLTECYRHNRYTSTKCALCETKPDGMGQCTCPDCVPGRWASCDASGKCKCLNGYSGQRCEETNICTGMEDGRYCYPEYNNITNALVECSRQSPYSVTSCPYGCQNATGSSTGMCKCENCVHGSCYDGDCHCDKGYSGKNCTETSFCTSRGDGMYCNGSSIVYCSYGQPTWTTACANGCNDSEPNQAVCSCSGCPSPQGWCLLDGTCICAAGFGGENCNTTTILPDYCERNLGSGTASFCTTQYIDAVKHSSYVRVECKGKAITKMSYCNHGCTQTTSTSATCNCYGNCFGKGWCNSYGQCTCFNSGYAPPYCSSTDCGRNNFWRRCTGSYQASCVFGTDTAYDCYPATCARLAYTTTACVLPEAFAQFEYVNGTTAIDKNKEAAHSEVVIEEVVVEEEEEEGVSASRNSFFDMKMSSALDHELGLQDGQNFTTICGNSYKSFCYNATTIVSCRSGTISFQNCDWGCYNDTLSGSVFVGYCNCKCSNGGSCDTRNGQCICASGWEDCPNGYSGRNCDVVDFCLGKPTGDHCDNGILRTCYNDWTIRKSSCVAGCDTASTCKCMDCVHGSCMPDGSCQCNRGWRGPMCFEGGECLNKTDGIYCQNNSTQLLCGYEGKINTLNCKFGCDVSTQSCGCENACSEHGVCYVGTCYCEGVYYGSDCSKKDRLDLLFPGIIAGSVFLGMVILYMVLSCVGQSAAIAQVYDPLRGDIDEFWFYDPFSEAANTEQSDEMYEKELTLQPLLNGATPKRYGSGAHNGPPRAPPFPNVEKQELRPGMISGDPATRPLKSRQNPPARRAPKDTRGVWITSQHSSIGESEVMGNLFDE